MEYVSIKVMERGIIHHYAIEYFPNTTKIKLGDQYLYNNHGIFSIMNCTPTVLDRVNETPDNTGFWRFCFLISQCIETDENGYTKFYACIDKARKNLYLYRTDQLMPVWDKARQRYSSVRINDGDKTIITPRGRCVPLMKDMFLEYDVDNLKNTDIGIAECSAMQWLKIGKQFT